MATYADVWREAESTLGTTFSLSVEGWRRVRTRPQARVRVTSIEWSLYYEDERGEGLTLEAATPEELLARIRALGQSSTPADVGSCDVGPRDEWRAAMRQLVAAAADLRQYPTRDTYQSIDAALAVARLLLGSGSDQ